MNDITVTIFI